MTTEEVVGNYALPLQGKPERAELYRWIVEEEEYVKLKFDDQRRFHDESLALNDLETFWFRQVVQYYDRATMYLRGAKQESDPEAKELLQKKALQALGKAMMTAKGLCESAIRVYGEMPVGGLTSGEIKVRDATGD